MPSRGAALVEAADSNYFDAFRAIGQVAGMPTLDADGILCIVTGLPAAGLNIMFVTEQLADPEGQPKAGMAFFDRLQLPFVMRIREGLDAGAEQAAERLGMPYSDTVPGMALSPIPTAPVPPEALAIERVGPDRLDAARGVLAAGFGMPLEFAQTFLAPATLELPGVACYLGSVEGTPVTTSLLFTTGRTAGLYNVATLESHRRRGLGEAMTWHAISEGARAGCAVSILQASEMGRPIYERMGFRLVSPYHTFHRIGV